MGERKGAVMSESVKFRGGAGWIAADRFPRRGTARGTAVMLHGGGQTRHSWRRAAAKISAAGWDVYTLDARGHGGSDWAADGDYTIDALVGDLRLVLGRLEHETGDPIRPVLFGASMGGMTSLVAEGEYPASARGLVLVDITPRVEPEGIARISEFMRGAPDGFADLAEVADAVARYQPNRKRPRNPEGLRKNVRQGADGRLYWHWDPAFHRLGANLDNRRDNHLRTTAAAARVEVPTLLVRGSDSDIVSSKGIAELCDLIPHAKVAEVAGAGHMVVGDDNSVFVEQVSEFLESV
ncbi:alpha/beta hydrolase [Nocardia rhamnosiphila]|uniref:alpha/beta fold hydrolase n=1 Tax=Nocardia rhamnosiphila TaxID=426716 RepID=UPI0033C9CF80